MKTTHLLNGLEHSISIEFEPQNPCENLSMVACIVTLGTRGMETGRSLGFTNQPRFPNLKVMCLSERPCLKKENVNRLLNTTWLTLAPTCTHREELCMERSYKW